MSLSNIYYGLAITVYLLVSISRKHVQFSLTQSAIVWQNVMEQFFIKWILLNKIINKILKKHLKLYLKDI